MNRLTLGAAVLSLLAPSAAFANSAAHGVWATEANEEGSYLEVTIAPCESDPGQTCGIISKAMGTEGESADYEHLGRTIIDAMNAVDATRFNGGTIWAPDEDKTYNSNMQLNGDVLTVKGCVFFICRGQDWTRVN